MRFRLHSVLSSLSRDGSRVFCAATGYSSGMSGNGSLYSFSSTEQAEAFNEFQVCVRNGFCEAVSEQDCFLGSISERGLGCRSDKIVDTGIFPMRHDHLTGPGVCDPSVQSSCVLLGTYPRSISTISGWKGGSCEEGSSWLLRMSLNTPGSISRSNNTRTVSVCPLTHA